MINNDSFGFFTDDSNKPVETFPFRGYVGPTFGSPFLSEERQFNLMFRSQIGAVDALGEIANFVNDNKDLDKDQMKEGIEKIVKDSAVYLRPETAQAMFVQFLNCQQTMSMKIPFPLEILLQE